jgi:D-alanyl-D-alanine dipeptidase
MAEALTRLEPGAHGDGLWVDPIYRRLGYDEALPDLWLRTEIVPRVLRASRDAVEHGHALLLWDGWRPPALQRRLYDEYQLRLARTSGLSGPPLDELVGQFVTDPERQEAPPAHVTGGALDLTLCDPATGTPRDMGGDFDELTARSHPDHYADDPHGSEYRRLRELLARVMDGADFVRLQSEWWHFEHGTALWAAERGVSVRLGTTPAPAAPG